MIRIEDPKLKPLWEKVQNNQRLTVVDGATLFRSDDLLAVGAMAHWVKEKRYGQRVTFVVNRQINPTNICALSCRFCDFSKKPNQPGAYTKSEAEILSQISSEVREVHITSGLNLQWTVEDYLDVVRAIKRKFPEIQVKAYTAVEIDFFAKRDKVSVKEILERMMEAGVVCLPGGGAEVFSERVRQDLFPTKIGADTWLDIHRVAHEMGLKSNSTLLYGHIETMEERLTHLERLRQLQDETHGFLSFIPLAYQPGVSQVVSSPPGITDDLRMIAVSRLFLDNFDHIKAYWVTIGEETASVSLHFGADDIDGTIGEEKIMHAAKALSPVQLAQHRLIGLIQDAGFVPVERDGLYQDVKEVIPV